MQRRFLLSLGAAAIFAAAFGMYFATRVDSPKTVAVKAEASARFTCPMHPSIVQGQPGTCPICGMTLVKLSDGSELAHSDLLHVDDDTQQRMGVRLMPAEVKELSRSLQAYAVITSDESRAVSVTAKVEGWIRRFHVQGVGQRIRQGQVLYELYSPELQQRQRDYVDLLTRRDGLLGSDGGMGTTGPNFAMLSSIAKELFRARDRLLAADIPSDELEKLEKNRRALDVMPIRATQNGIVTSIAAREGSYVNPMQPILVYADQSSVWAEITLYPDQIGWLKNDDRITLTSGLDASVKTVLKVDLTTLQIDPVSRAAKLRLPLTNTKDAFLPGSYADATIESAPRRTLSVPKDAVIRTGRGQFVVVSAGNGHFRSAPVTLGIEDDTSVEILSGLVEGDSIAVNGQFLLDAASSLQSMQSRLTAVSPSSDASDQEAIKRD